MIPSEEVRLRDLFKSLRFLWVSAAILLLAIVLEPITHRKDYVRVNARQVQRDFHASLHRLEKKADEFRRKVAAYGWPDVMVRDEGFIDLYARETDGLAFFLFQGDSLLFWSENSLVASNQDLLGMETHQVHSLSNCWVYTRIYPMGESRLIGFVFLKKFFPYNNEFVDNAFLIGRNIPDNWRIGTPPVPGAIALEDEHGNYVFSIYQRSPVESNGLLNFLVLSLYFLTLVSLLLMLRDMLLLGQRLKPSGWWLLALLGDLVIIRWVSWYFKVPRCLYDLPVFQPFEDPAAFFASRGDILFSIVLILFFAYWFNRYFEIFPWQRTRLSNRTNPRLTQSLALIGWLLALLVFVLSSWLVRYLLDRMEGLLEVYRALTINFSQVLDLFMVLGIQSAFLLILFRIMERIKGMLTWKQSFTGFVLASAIVFGALSSLGHKPAWMELIFLLAVVCFFLYFFSTGAKRFSHAYMVVLLILVSAFEVAIISQVNREKDTAIRARMLERLSNEHDPIAEMLLAQYEPQIEEDTVLAGIVMDPRIEQAEVAAYLKSRYFGLYWNRYQIQPLICDSTSRAIIQPDMFYVPCLDHFIHNVKDRFGKKLPGSERFFYLDNFDGLIDYLGLFDFYSPDSSLVSTLIINIDSRLVTQELGYPELLITGKIDYDSLNREYTYAKYHRGFLQSVSGDFEYSYTSRNYPGRLGEKVSFESDGFDHMIFRFDEMNEIVISRHSFRLIDYFITFSYCFVFFYLTWVLLHLAFSLRRGLKWPVIVLKQRIQITMVSILVVSFLLIGGGMAYYSIQQYHQSTQKLIKEKTGTLLTDIQYKLSMEQSLDPGWHDASYRSLEELLIKFSYVFNTDINLYDPAGGLLASSRPEVYEYNLIGQWMSPVAYHELHYLGKKLFIHRESIESLGYFSSYMPIFNQNEKLIGYLNLPYFSRQSQFRNEISTMVVAILNALLILILLSVFLAILLADQVTRPLQLIRSKLAGLRLGHRNQGIEYHREDEIGQLVKEYNRMVQELQASAEKLARSERESAWREMARQIAHEIKNPLTPMKLSVQHLRKAWKDGSEDLGRHIDKVTRTLIDQIDTLSAIAAEFSKFAKMPGANFEPIDLVARLRSITALFEESCRIRFRLDKDVPAELFIYADREQLLQVFNNLIRNAIQAVPEGKEPEVNISVGVEGESAIVRIRDNGTGIPEDLRGKMFEPNFTTKSSGMGLGLAISKRIVEGSGGAIWFETSTGDGTTFYISLPLHSAE